MKLLEVGADDHEQEIFPPINGINSVTGIGKSSAAREVIRELLPLRPQGTTIYLAAPTHALAEELATKMQGEFKDDRIIVKAYRGLSADDPECPGEKMCRIAADAESLRNGGVDIRKLCAVERDGDSIFCPHYDECGYQRQQGFADVWIIPQNLLVRRRPAFLLKAAALVVDESPISAFVSGLDGPPRTISVYDLGAARRVPKVEGNFAKDEDGTKFLNSVKAAISRVLNETEPNIPILTTIVADAGLSLNDILYARDLIFRCKGRIDVSPDMTTVKRRDAVEVAKGNQRLLMEARFWNLVARALENGWPTIPGFRIESDEKGKNRFPVVRMRWREEVHSHWHAPTLLMDATANWDLIRPFWPRLDLIEKFDASMPFTTVRQVLWSASKSKLSGDATTQYENRHRVRRYIEARSTEFGSVLVVCQQFLESELIRISLPNNVSVCHFNALRGLDKYGEVDCLIVIGRTQPPPDQAEMMAEVIFGSVPDRGADWEGSYYPRRPVGLCTRDQEAAAEVDYEHHPDPIVEAVRWAACEGELIQAIGRARAVNRTVNTPLQIDIVGTVPLPIEVDEVVDWDEAQADPFLVMLARGVIPDCDRSERGYWNVVSAIMPDRFKDTQAAKDWGRTLTVESTNKNILISESHREGFIRAFVRVKGARYKAPVLIVCGDDDPYAFAEQVMGPLELFELDG